MNGAKLIAVHKNRFCQTKHGLQLDIGAFIHGLEYASGSEAVIIGKPTPAFFQVALDEMGLSKDEVLMIGDDIDSDIGGAQKAGLKAVLVRTGNTAKPMPKLQLSNLTTSSTPSLTCLRCWAYKPFRTEIGHAPKPRMR